MISQSCTKCGINKAIPQYILDKDLGYCEECASLLHLGESKDAREIEYPLSLRRQDEQKLADIDSEAGAGKDNGEPEGKPEPE